MGESSIAEQVLASVLKPRHVVADQLDGLGHGCLDDLADTFQGLSRLGAEGV